MCTSSLLTQTRCETGGFLTTPSVLIALHVRNPHSHTCSYPARERHAEALLDDDPLHLRDWLPTRKFDVTVLGQQKHVDSGLLHNVADRTKQKLHSWSRRSSCYEDNPLIKMGTVPQVTSR